MTTNHNGGSHSVVNVDDMIERGLDNSQYWELMKREGKVIEYQPAGVTDFPSVLIGFTEEQVYNEIQLLLYTLPLADMLETVHNVLRQYRVQYECKNLLGTDTYIFDFPQIEGGKLMYMKVRPKLIHPSFGLYSGYSFPDSVYDTWMEWGRRLESWMIRSNLDKAIDCWRNAREEAAGVPPIDVDPPGGLSYVEQRIKTVYDEILAKGEQFPTDEAIAAKLPLSRKGQPYTRETVCRYRNKMREQGIVV